MPRGDEPDRPESAVEVPQAAAEGYEDNGHADQEDRMHRAGEGHHTVEALLRRCHPFAVKVKFRQRHRLSDIPDGTDHTDCALHQ